MYQKDCIDSDDRILSEIFNEYFIIITKTIDLKPSTTSTTTCLPEIIETFKDYLALTILNLWREECQLKFIL